MAVPAELAKSAYQIGRGFVTAEENPATAQDEQTSVAAQSDQLDEQAKTVSQDPAAEPGDSVGSVETATEDLRDGDAAPPMPPKRGGQDPQSI